VDPFPVRQKCFECVGSRVWISGLTLPPGEMMTGGKGVRMVRAEDLKAIS
jgi:hypothetical protein